MKAEIISCGTELLLGHQINTNAAYISKALSHIGIDVYHHITVGDNKQRVSNAINVSLSRSDITIITGGLGPTVDDITIAALAHVTNRDKEALIPRGSRWIKNEVGTAPGLIIKDQNRYLIALPGPPRELKPMLEKEVIPFLKNLHQREWMIKSKGIKLIGLPEARVNEKVKDLLKLSGQTTVGIYTRLGEVELKITAKADSEKRADSYIKRIEQKIKKRLGNFIYGTDDETLQEIIGRIFTKRKITLAVAESCTGGYISNLITNAPGSSKYFTMGIVAYSDKTKIENLNISKDIIKKHGAVSKETAKAMAENVRGLAKVDTGLGVTGIAGPTGATNKKPVGLIYIAIATKKKTIVKEFRFLGSREEIKLQASQQALNMLRLLVPFGRKSIR